MILLLLPLNVAAMEESAFIEEDSISIPESRQFIDYAILRQFINTAHGTISRLTENDYREVAAGLDVEVAAIKAVVDIETGRCHEGFCAPHRPIIDFDTNVFRRFCTRKKINLNLHKGHCSVIFGRGTGQDAEHLRLDTACRIDSTTAIESTFWGMFQIGGFNWKLCGATDLNDFVRKMQDSERSQLELFARFITNTGLVKHLRTKDWRAFAYRYNGPKYAARAYHTRLARAYRLHSK